MTVGLLQKDSIVRGQQLDLIVKKLEETVEKFHDLTINMTKMLTAHDMQIQELKVRTDDTRDDLEETVKALSDSKHEFVEAVRLATKELSSSNHSDMEKLKTRLENLESWRNRILGAGAVLTTLAFFVDGPELVSKFFGLLQGTK